MARNIVREILSAKGVHAELLSLLAENERVKSEDIRIDGIRALAKKFPLEVVWRIFSRRVFDRTRSESREPLFLEVMGLLSTFVQPYDANPKEKQEKRNKLSALRSKLRR